jgi:predicted nucleic acid-binding Zn ribbon protein
MDRLGDDVSRELSRVGGGPSGSMPRIVETWTGAVGRTIARNAWPARIARDGTLHVATSSSSWAFELQQLEADILRRVRAAAAAAAPERIRFAVGKLPETGLEDGDEVASTRMPEPGPEQREKAAALTASIADDELREVVAKAAAQSLANAASIRPF